MSVSATANRRAQVPQREHLRQEPPLRARATAVCLASQLWRDNQRSKTEQNRLGPEVELRPSPTRPWHRHHINTELADSSTIGISLRTPLPDRRHGGLHVAFNNVGILGKPKLTAEIEEDEWAEILATNLTEGHEGHRTRWEAPGKRFPCGLRRTRHNQVRNPRWRDGPSLVVQEFEIGSCQAWTNIYNKRCGYFYYLNNINPPFFGLRSASGG